MHRFGFSEIRGNLPYDIVELIGAIREMRGGDALRRREYPREMGRSRFSAEFDAVKFSNDIEGIRTTDRRLVSMMTGGSEPTTRDEKEIAGYCRALRRVNSRHDEMDFDLRTIKLLHREMMSLSGIRGGEWKVRDNAILSVDDEGRREVVFTPVPATETPDAMEQLYLAYCEERDAGTEPLLLIPCVILDFLSIHPFPDGNGRTSRLLTDILLYNAGYGFPEYVSMDRHIALTRGSYYKTLAESSAGWVDNNWTYIPFVRYFLHTVYECYMDLDTMFALVNDRKLTADKRMMRLFNNSLAPVSKAQVLRALPDVSVSTVEAFLRRSVRGGYLEKVGTFRDARYRVRREGEAMLDGSER